MQIPHAMQYVGKPCRTPAQIAAIAARLTRIMLADPRSGAPPWRDQLAAAQALMQIVAGRYLGDDQAETICGDVARYLERAVADDQTAPYAAGMLVSWGML